ncbi:MAG: DUF1993 domain-containing protein [Myxococcales bacterium]|nr:DUF1993 domain-containing protein [Myxococcales bacterium]
MSSLYDLTVPQLTKLLGNLVNWLDEATEYAATRKFNPDVLATAFLSPDQFNLTRQVQSACDNAKFMTSRVTGRTPPKHPDEEKTIAELKARVQSVIEYLNSFTEADFADADSRVVPLFFLPGKGMKARDYVMQFALPNFFFHLVSAYSILRHNGVQLGKYKFIGGLDLVDL